MVDDAELAEAAGINVSCPMLSARRRLSPGEWRIGDDLVIRRAEDGGIQHFIGYFSKSQIDWRRRWSAALCDELKNSVFERYRRGCDEGV